MPTAKEKRIKARLEQIKEAAASAALNPKQADVQAVAGLAEEAAGLALEALTERK